MCYKKIYLIDNTCLTLLYFSSELKFSLSFLLNFLGVFIFLIKRLSLFFIFLKKLPNDPKPSVKSNNLKRLSYWILVDRSSRPKVFLEKGVLKTCDNFTGEHPCQSVISITLLCNFIEIALRHGCSSVNLLHISRIPFSRNTSGWLLLLIKTYNSKHDKHRRPRNVRNINSVLFIYSCTLDFCQCVYIFRSSRREVFLKKGVLKICSKFIWEHPCRSAILIKLLCNLAMMVWKPW